MSEEPCEGARHELFLTGRDNLLHALSPEVEINEALTVVEI